MSGTPTPNRGLIERTIERAAYTSWVFHYSASRVESSGGVSWEYSGGQWRRAHVTQPEALGFDVGVTGESDPLRFVMVTMGDEGFGDDDRVYFDYGTGIEPYRTVEVKPQPYGDEIMLSWTLKDDLRGTGSDGTGAPPTATPPDGSGGDSDGGSGGSDGGDGGGAVTPSGTLEDFESGDLGGYDGDKTNVTVAEDSRADGTYGLAVRGTGAEIWRRTPEGEGPRTTRGSYYTYSAEAGTWFSGDPQAVHLTLGVDPVNGTVLGSGSGYLVSIAANQSVAIQSRPPGAPFESDITDTASGAVPPDSPITVEVRWDDGSLGGADGEIAVSVYDENGTEAATATASDTSISEGTFGWVVEGGTDPRSFVDTLRAEPFAP